MNDDQECRQKIKAIANNVSILTWIVGIWFALWFLSSCDKELDKSRARYEMHVSDAG